MTSSVIHRSTPAASFHQTSRADTWPLNGGQSFQWLHPVSESLSLTFPVRGLTYRPQGGALSAQVDSCSISARPSLTRLGPSRPIDAQTQQVDFIQSRRSRGVKMTGGRTRIRRVAARLRPSIYIQSEAATPVPSGNNQSKARHSANKSLAYDLHIRNGSK